ncbi:hypothetical protein [Robiginitalea myxolifaciens]|uniref:hypothetical protein n=1 Tax=Robiginitalea myxolifaciens TaxID=400055 RepID=UPI001FEB5877|nr:hypothetical protein [Robiginitalea myxolifaciens]
MNSKQLLYIGIFGITALTILVDFVAPGTSYEKEIQEVRKTLQRYYNAGGNYHYSYKVITADHEFLIDEDLVKSAIKGQLVGYTISPIFSQTNWCRLPGSTQKSYHSLRLASGLILPLIFLLVLFISFRFKKRIGTLVFILQILVLADLIFLLS